MSDEGKAQVTGGKDLKQTQCYPIRMGLAIAELHKSSMSQPMVKPEMDVDDCTSDAESHNSCLEDVSEAAEDIMKRYYHIGA